MLRKQQLKRRPDRERQSPAPHTRGAERYGPLHRVFWSGLRRCAGEKRSSRKCSAAASVTASRNSPSLRPRKRRQPVLREECPKKNTRVQPKCVLRTQLTKATKATMIQAKSSSTASSFNNLMGVVDDVASGAAALQRSLVGLQFEGIVNEIQVHR